MLISIHMQRIWITFEVIILVRALFLLLVTRIRLSNRVIYDLIVTTIYFPRIWNIVKNTVIIITNVNKNHFNWHPNESVTEGNFFI